MNGKFTSFSRCLLGAACLYLGSMGVWAQGTTTPSDEGTTPAQQGMVTLNFPENVDLRVLVDYVGKRLNINFVFDETVGARKVTLKVPAAIPSDMLMTLLESVLKMHGLVAVQTEVPGLMRVENVKQLTTIAVGPGTTGDVRLTQPVTRVFELRHAPTAQMQQLVTPYLSSNLASVTVLADRGLVMVTDYAGNVARIEQLMSVIDRPRREVAVRQIAVVHTEAAGLAQRVTQVISSKAKAQGGDAPGAGATTLSVLPDERTNQLTVVGLPGEVEEVVELIRSMDVSLGLETKVYALTTAAPEQVDRLVKSLIGELTAKRLYQSATDREANLLIATTTAQVHERIAGMLEVLDKPVAEAQSPIRFYKLENAKALDVLSTLQDIEGEGLAGVSLDGATTAGEGVTSGQRERTQAADRVFIDGPTQESLNTPGLGATDAGKDGQRRGGGRSVQLRDARLIADEATNTIIMIAPPSMHAVYEKLIQRLDVRRPQVLVDVTIVVLDTSDNFSLGVEIKRRDGVDGGNLLNFTSFGLSTRNPPGTGALTLQPGLGFTGALISADIAEVVIRALESDSRARVLSRPSILVNDNATGSLVSENEEPFTTLIATGEASREGFGGFVKAGTNLTITPQISEGDYLKLEYEATLSSFSSEGSETLPPARQSNTLKSVATIPDGYTIVVGGLTRENLSESVDRVPILGRIPLVEYLFSNRSKEARQATLFVFIRPVILRDDKFKHLKILSSQAATQAQLLSDFPTSEPAAVR